MKHFQKLASTAAISGVLLLTSLTGASAFDAHAGYYYPEPQTREVWTPTAANFFGRVGGPYMVEIWRDLLDLAEDHPTATTFAKLKKGEKAAKLEALFTQSDLRSALGVTEAQAAKIDAWLPEGME